MRLKESPVKNLAQQQLPSTKIQKTPKQEPLPKTVITSYLKKLMQPFLHPQNQLVKTEETKEQAVKKKKYVDPKILFVLCGKQRSYRKDKRRI